MKYRKKPVEVEAFRINIDYIPDWFMDKVTTNEAMLSKNPRHETFARIQTLEGVLLASPGDYIIRGIKGEIYPCKPDIFEATYEPVEE